MDKDPRYELGLAWPVAKKKAQKSEKPAPRPKAVAKHG